MNEIRIGHGYDVHRLVDGDGITIGGVKIPCEKTLLAHSDGDVLLHAIADALLGAAGERDIGYHFPDNDNKFKNIDSKILLAKVVEIINQKGFDIEYVDSTIIAQAPKMAPYIDMMRDSISDVLNVERTAVNVKATTEEHLGFTGRKEGISAHSVCILKSKK